MAWGFESLHPHHISERSITIFWLGCGPVGLSPPGGWASLWQILFRTVVIFRHLSYLLLMVFLSASAGQAAYFTDGRDREAIPELRERVAGDPSGASDLDRAIRKVAGSDSHYPECTLICVENTANVGGGSIYEQDTLDAICEVAHSNDCRAHLDGARMFNAVVASGVDAARMVRDFDTISICLSKGLGAPVGSVLVGDTATITEAHRWRKMFGGGMRQAGVLAAAGLYALENNIDRLAKDHARARRLAEAVDAMEAYSIDLGAVQSNMVYINCEKGRAKALVEKLSQQGVDVLDLEQGVDYGDVSTVRAVVHLHVTDEDIDRTIAAFDAAQ